MKFDTDNIRSAALVIVTIVGAITSVLALGDTLGSDFRFAAIFMVGAVAAMSTLMLRYLRLDDSDDDEPVLPSRRAMLARLDQLNSQLAQLKDEGKVVAVPDDERQQLIARLAEQIKGETADSILAAIEQRVSQRIVSEIPLEAVTQAFENTSSRLSREIESLSRRGNINLVIGLVTAMSGLLILGFVVFSKPVADLSISDALIFLLPRISLVMFVEIFAYFFLRLYRLSLDDIKYFQNELTGIEARYLGLQVALSHGEETVNQVVGMLAQIDRNKTLSDLKSVAQKPNGGQDAKKLVDSALALSKQAQEMFGT
ncbi:hypothetical protein [Crateriforma spongiae]|uniref:hypothetical protein n=1 Tax=Crateriforma spongiae TaxID=2724528 RepID=UPI00144829A4|nr:hypothetical protein [Crateriforma spongiae]